MALLSQMFRAAAITGRTDAVSASWFAGRQGGRWADQTVAAALPNVPGRHPAPPADAADQLRDVADLQRRGVLSAAEAEALRGQLG